MIRFSELIARGLDSKAERAALAALLGLAVLYGGALGFFQIKDVPIGVSFMAKRDAVRLAHAVAAPLPFDQRVEVSNGITISPHIALLAGWSSPEPGGIWSTDRMAVAGVGIPPATAPLTLLLGLNVMRDRKGEQTLTLYGNDRWLGQWTFTTGQARLRIHLPMAPDRTVRLLKLRFIIGTPTRPPGSGDARTLGIGLDTVELTSGT